MSGYSGGGYGGRSYGDQGRGGGPPGNGGGRGGDDYPPPPRGGGGRDRMAELRAGGGGYNSAYDSAMDIEMSATDGRGDGGAATAFLDQVAGVDRKLRQLGEDIQQIEVLQRRTFDSVPDQQAQRTRDELDDVTGGARNLLDRIRAQLGALDARLQGDLRPGTADYVMCANQLVTLKKKCQELLRSFHALETQFSQRQRDRMLREMRVIKPDATMADVDEYIDAGGGAGGQLFAQEVLHSSRYADAQNALRSVQDRQTEIRKIEATVEQLATMFQDLNTLLEQQDYQVNQIAEYTENLVQDLAKGEQQVEKAIESRRNTIKWLWYLCAIILVILIAITIYLLFRFGVIKTSSSNPPPASTPAPSATPTP